MRWLVGFPKVNEGGRQKVPCNQAIPLTKLTSGVSTVRWK